MYIALNLLYFLKMMCFLYFSTAIQATAELIHTSEESGFFVQLEALRAESAATKEELASYKEKAEKLQEELLVK